jgi:hypothetical protein
MELWEEVGGDRREDSMPRNEEGDEPPSEWIDSKLCSGYIKVICDYSGFISL